MMLSRFTANHFLPYGAAALLVFFAAAYLCLANLNYVSLWYDEAPTAFIGKQLLEQGDIVGWDGVNLIGGSEARTLNDDLRDVLPPLSYIINALSFALFDDRVIAARLLHALLGVVALACFYVLLRQFIGASPRLVFFVFTLTALFPQLLLFFRQSRYFSFLVLTFIMAVYLYERFWQHKQTGVFVALVATVVLAFFNFYTSAAVIIVTLATYHLLFRARATSQREWLMFVAGGVVIAAFGFIYFSWLGFFDGERGFNYQKYTGTNAPEHWRGPVPAVIYRLYIYFRELFRVDWVSWWVALWFVWLVREMKPWAKWIKKPAKKSGKKGVAVAKKPGKKAPAADSFEMLFVGAGRLIIYGFLFVLFSALFSVQLIQSWAFADLRYYIGVIPFLLVMKALLVEWLWRRWRWAGGLVFAALLFSSVGAAPFNVENYFTKKSTLGFHLFDFVREIHRPYRDMNAAVSRYLLENAERGDLVWTADFFDREALTVATDSYVQFCCYIGGKTPLSKKQLRELSPSLFRGEQPPDWIVDTQVLMTPDEFKRFDAEYGETVLLKLYFYNTQRPEINFHLWEPNPFIDHRGIYIHKRIK